MLITKTLTLQGMVSKLQEKNRMYKKLAENAEEMATANLARLRRAQVKRII